MLIGGSIAWFVLLIRYWWVLFGGFYALFGRAWPFGFNGFNDLRCGFGWFCGLFKSLEVDALNLIQVNHVRGNIPLESGCPHHVRLAALLLSEGFFVISIQGLDRVVVEALLCVMAYSSMFVGGRMVKLFGHISLLLLGS